MISLIVSTWKNQFVNIVWGQFYNVNLYKVYTTYISSLYPFFQTFYGFIWSVMVRGHSVWKLWALCLYLLLIYCIILYFHCFSGCSKLQPVFILLIFQLPLQSRHNKISQSPALKSYRTLFLAWETTILFSISNLQLLQPSKELVTINSRTLFHCNLLSTSHTPAVLFNGLKIKLDRYQ